MSKSSRNWTKKFIKIKQRRLISGLDMSMSIVDVKVAPKPLDWAGFLGPFSWNWQFWENGPKNPAQSRGFGPFDHFKMIIFDHNWSINLIILADPQRPKWSKWPKWTNRRPLTSQFLTNLTYFMVKFDHLGCSLDTSWALFDLVMSNGPWPSAGARKTLAGRP